MASVDEAAALAFMESCLWPDGPVCPKCGETRRIELMNGQSTRPGTRRCRACRRKFHVTTGTVMHGSHVPLSAWLKAFELVRVCGQGTIRVGRACGLTTKSALFLVRRIRQGDREASAILGTSQLPDVMARRCKAGGTGVSVAHGEAEAP